MRPYHSRAIFAPQLLELEFPPLLGGQRAKRVTDDFTNIDVLDANRDWAVAFACDPQTQGGEGALAAGLKSRLWVAFPDEKELELTREEFMNSKFKVRAAGDAIFESYCILRLAPLALYLP